MTTIPLRISVPFGPADVVLRLVEARPGSAQAGAPVPGARSL